MRYHCICHTPNYLSGVDSSEAVTQKLYQCLLDRFGKPAFWGRYLQPRPNINDGLSAKEVELLHGQGIKIIAVDNDFHHPVGTEAGKHAATRAVAAAEQIGMPKGKVIFADIEPNYKSDANWIEAWVCTVLNSGYTPGLYSSPRVEPFQGSFCQASKMSTCVRDHVIVWSVEPQQKMHDPSHPPAFKPYAPTGCLSKVWGYQYRIDYEICEGKPYSKLDFSLFNSSIEPYIW